MKPAEQYPKPVPPGNCFPFQESFVHQSPILLLIHPGAVDHIQIAVQERILHPPSQLPLLLIRQLVQFFQRLKQILDILRLIFPGTDGILPHHIMVKKIRKLHDSSLPDSDDWRGEKISPVLDAWGNDWYYVSRNNQLWYSEKNDYHYKFYMDLGTGYSGGRYYIKALAIKDKIYVLPGSAQNLLIIKNKKIRKIEFKTQISRPGAFCSYWYNEKYIFLFPNQYPLLLRFNIETEELQGIDGIRQFNVRNVSGEWRIGGIGVYGNELVFASPVDHEFIFVDMDTLKARGLCSHSKCNLGTQSIVTDGEELWLLPMDGKVITCWNPGTGEVR